MAHNFSLRDKHQFLDAARSFRGDFYKWGGDDPSGFDCSGLVVECLATIRAIPKGSDFTAQGLFSAFSTLYQVDEPEAGCIAFYGPIGSISHVVICLDPEYAIGANGGYSKTKTLDDAIKHNAFIKARRIDDRPGPVHYINLFKEI